MRIPSLLLCLLVSSATAQSSVTRTSPTATLVAKASLLGMKLGVQNKWQEGKFSSASNSCVQALKSDELVPGFTAAIAESMGIEDLQAADAFLTTPLGEKYAASALLRGYVAHGLELPQPMPEFSDKELAELQAFCQTSAGRKLMQEELLSIPVWRQMIRAGLLKLVEPCGLR